VLAVVALSFMKSMNKSCATNTNLGAGEVTLPARGGYFAFHFAAEYFDRGCSVIPLVGKVVRLMQRRQRH
jgi:hypothetical protein